MFRRILVGWDGSAGSGDALMVALEIVGAEGEVSALAVVNRPAHTEVRDDAEREISAASRFLQERLEPFEEHARRQGCTLRSVILEGSRPDEVIRGYASEHAFDLIVVGRNGQAEALHFGLGHVAELVARLSDQPVLLPGRARD